MKTALVTGATGFVGGYLAKRLRDEGYQVTCTGRNPAKGAELVKQGFHFVPLDLATCTDQELEHLGENFDRTFSYGSTVISLGKREQFISANVIATQRLLDHALKCGTGRFVYVSSPSVYVSQHENLNIAETQPIPKINVNYYIESKKISEELLDSYNSKGVSSITLRPQGIIGKGDPSVFPRILKAIDRGVLPIIGDGSVMIDLTPVENVVDSLICAANAEQQHCGKSTTFATALPSTC